MSSLNNGLWRAPQNTKMPGPSLILSYRVTGLVPTTGTALQTFALPTTASNPAQYNQVQAPQNFAITSSPTATNNEPQQGLSLLVTQMLVRDANGILFGVAATNNTVVSLIDQNYNSSGAWTSSMATSYTAQVAAAANTVIAVTTTAAVSAAPAGGRAPYVSAQIGVSNGTQGGTAGDATGVVVVNPYDNLAVAVLVPAGTVTTAATATAFTIDLIGMWIPAI